MKVANGWIDGWMNGKKAFDINVYSNIELPKYIVTTSCKQIPKLSYYYD